MDNHSPVVIYVTVFLTCTTISFQTRRALIDWQVNKLVYLIEVLSKSFVSFSAYRIIYVLEYRVSHSINVCVNQLLRYLCCLPTGSPLSNLASTENGGVVQFSECI